MLFFLPQSNQAGRAKQDFREERSSLRVELTSPPLRIIRIPGVGRQQSVPVRGGEKREQRRYFLRGSLLGAGECGTRAGQRPPGSIRRTRSSTEPRLADRCAVHSDRGAAQHSREILLLLMACGL